MTKTKVLFIAESLNIGGAEKALVTLLTLLDYSKLDVTLLLVSESGSLTQEAKAINNLKIKHIVKPQSSKLITVINAIKIKSCYNWLLPKFVGNTISKGYDVVVAFTEGYLTKWVAASTVKCRKIAWVHTDMVNNDWPVNTGVFDSFEEEKQSYLKFNNIVAVSDNVARGMTERFGCNNVETIYNIVDNSIISKSKVVLSVDKLLQKRTLNLVSVGRLEWIKGYDQLISALNILVNEYKVDVSLCIVGDGSQRDLLEQQIEKEGLRDYVKLIGSQKNPYPYIASADVFICPSRQEGFNIAILEAMTLGKPIVAAYSAGPDEILDHGAYGLLVENSINGLADSIIKLYRNRGLLDEYSALSMKRSEFFNPVRQLKNIETLILS